MKHIHFIGIGGTGLSAIARVLLEKGYMVSGSDREASDLFKAVKAAGAVTFVGHAAEQIAGADLVIRSSAIPDDNPEVLAARSHGIPVIKRAEFLQELTAGKDTIAVAGSHGKTTTTAMLIWVFEQLGQDPSFIVGGVMNQLDCNAHAGTGSVFIIEADEYDNMFLGLSPKIAVVTNIDYDHPDFFPTEASYLSAYSNFINCIQPGGTAIYCSDDQLTRTLHETSTAKNIHFMRYGTTSEADYQAEQISLHAGHPQFNLICRKGEETQHFGTVKLNLTGHHNVLNATATLAVIHQMGLPVDEAKHALSLFSGVGRRFEILGTVQGITIIDDYGHHPTQLAATLMAARASYPGRRLWAVWQPHTYSRTMALEQDYLHALDLADKVLVLSIYSAREEDPGYSAEKIAQGLSKEKAEYCSDFETATAHLSANLQEDDVLILFSAGDATCVSQTLYRALKQESVKVK